MEPELVIRVRELNQALEILNSQAITLELKHIEAVEYLKDLQQKRQEFVRLSVQEISHIRSDIIKETIVGQALRQRLIHNASPAWSQENVVVQHEELQQQPTIPVVSTQNRSRSADPHNLTATATTTTTKLAATKAENILPPPRKNSKVFIPHLPIPSSTANTKWQFSPAFRMMIMKQKKLGAGLPVQKPFK
eukprot:PhF_6_TR22406/c0_g1_i1/m.31811